MADFSQHGGDWNGGNCASRHQQSPIDFDALFVEPNGKFSFFYNDVHTQQIFIKNDGNTVHLDTVGQGFGGITPPLEGSPWYNLKAIDFRAKSEHTFRGKHTPLEIQLVHQTSTIADPTYGTDLVIVSIPVICDSPPSENEVWPGLIQKGKGRKGSPADFIDEAVAEEEGRDDDQDDRPAEAKAEIEVVHSLATASSDTTVSSKGQSLSTASIMNYSAPAEGAPGFNAFLKFFTEQEPPVVDDTVTVNITSDNPLRIGPLLEDGIFFMYAGSQTLPPCEEKVTWFVRRNPIKASNDQVKAMSDAIFKLSAGAGNYRTVMPLNQRPINILNAVEEEPGPKPFTLQPPYGPPWGIDDGRESKYMDAAKDAITISKSSLDYAKDLNARLLNSAKKHYDAMKPENTPAPPAPPTTTMFVPEKDQEMWVMNKIGQTMVDAVRDGIEKSARAAVQPMEQLTKSYMRQDLLRRAGFTTPPPGPFPLYPGAVQPHIARDDSAVKLGNQGPI
jgi:carbonic anhydrase